MMVCQPAGRAVGRVGQGRRQQGEVAGVVDLLGGGDPGGGRGGLGGCRGAGAVDQDLGGFAGAGREVGVEQLLAVHGLDRAAKRPGLRQPQAGVGQAERAGSEDRGGQHPHQPGPAGEQHPDPTPHPCWRQVGADRRCGGGGVGHEWPEHPPAADGEQRGQQGEAGEQPGGDAEGGDGAEAAVGVQVAGQQTQQRGDDGAGRCGDHRGGGADGGAQRGPVVGAGVQLLAVAGDEQQRVVGGGAEDQHVQDAGGQVGDGQQVVAGEHGDDGLGAEQTTGDAEHRQQPQQRAAVDQKE